MARIVSLGRNGYLILKELGEEVGSVGRKIMTNADGFHCPSWGMVFCPSWPMGNGGIAFGAGCQRISADARLKEELGYMVSIPVC